MKNTLLSLFMTICFLGTANATDKEQESNNCLISHKGREYVVKSQEATYPEIMRELSHNFTAKNELNDLFDSFRTELQKDADISLGHLETALKSQIRVCEEIFPLFVEFRRFMRPQRTVGVIEGTMFPQISTTDKIRRVSNTDNDGAQETVSKATFVLDSNKLTQILQKKQKDKKKNSNEWEYVDQLAKLMGTLSFTVESVSTYQEGGKKDPVQTLSLVDANMSQEAPEAILKDYEEKMLKGPNAIAFTQENVKGVIGVFIYAPKGQEFPARWGTTSTRAATQFWDEKH